MSASVLLVTGDEAFAREVFRSEGRADWAQAMPLVLEKLGYLDFETADPRALADERVWNAPRVLLVARVPAGAWSDRAIELARRGRARALIEHPPAALHDALGVLEAGPAPREGVVTALTDDLRAAVAASTTWSSTRLELPQSREVPREEELDWDRVGVPITQEQAERWRTPGWDTERWKTNDDTQVLAEWLRPDGPERWPAIVERGRLMASCFSIFGYLGQQTTVQPSARSQYINWGRSTALEVLLGALLDRMHRRVGIARARVLPWPINARWVLSIRHDYDRGMTGAEIERIVQRHRRAGSAATWYWRARHLDGGDRDLVARRVDRTAGQEVAHHTEQLWGSATEERRTIERAIARPVSGTCAHGDPRCFRWQGAPNVLWAEREGLSYTEFISHAHPHPHRFCALRSDGTLAHARVICLPHHVSLDRSMTPGDAAAEYVLNASEEYVRGGGMLQILSHPDINIDPLFELIDRLPIEGRFDLTARDASDWWRRSHVRDELQVVRRSDGTVMLTSTRGVRGLVVEILRPDGSAPRHVVQIDPCASIVLDAGGASHADPARRRQLIWKRQATPVFAEAARAYYAMQGIGTTSQEVKTTIATNTELVPARVEAIIRYLQDFQGLDSLFGARVLDLGGGFGAFAVYLALDPDSPHVTTVDVRADFVAVTREVAARLGVDNLEAIVSDMRSLGELSDHQFDIVILNNSFLYLTSKEAMRRAIAEIARVLRPGGRVIFFHANRWRFREPFTGAPIVHLLPPRIADAVCRLTGWRHNHGRVLLVGAPWLARELRRAGFANVRTGSQGGVRGLPKSWLVGFYATTARLPDR